MQAAVVWLESHGCMKVEHFKAVAVTFMSLQVPLLLWWCSRFGSMLVQAVPHEPWESFDPKDSLQQGAVAL